METPGGFKVPEGQRYGHKKRIYWYLKRDGTNYIAVWRYWENSRIDQYRRKVKNYYYSESEAERALVVKVLKKAKPLESKYQKTIDEHFWKLLLK